MRVPPEPATRKRPPSLRARLQLAVDAAAAKKADAPVVLDLRSLSSFTDYFVIVSGGSGRQVQAIAEEVERSLRAAKVRPGHVEGRPEAGWVLLDYLDFVVHVFTPDRRDFYALERLWADAPRAELRPAVGPARAAAPRTPRA